VAGTQLNLIEEAPGDRTRLDCVEIYLPKSIEFLSELYRFLREKVTQRFGQVVLDGFSVYEVDGVFRGERLWEQRTLVIRLLLVRPAGKTAGSVAWVIGDLGREIATTIAVSEEVIWICQYEQVLHMFTGMKRVQR
jgi:hypothetical protein